MVTKLELGRRLWQIFERTWKSDEHPSERDQNAESEHLSIICREIPGLGVNGPRKRGKGRWRMAHEWDVMLTEGELFPDLKPEAVQKIKARHFCCPQQDI